MGWNANSRFSIRSTATRISQGFWGNSPSEVFLAVHDAAKHRRQMRGRFGFGGQRFRGRAALNAIGIAAPLPGTGTAEDSGQDRCIGCQDGERETPGATRARRWRRQSGVRPHVRRSRYRVRGVRRAGRTPAQVLRRPCASSATRPERARSRRGGQDESGAAAGPRRFEGNVRRGRMREGPGSS